MNRAQILEYILHLDGWLSLHEGFFLYEAAKNGKGKGEIVEIGSWMGKSTICLAAGSSVGKKTKVYAIDPHKGEYTRNNKIGKKSPTFKSFQQNIKRVGLHNLVKSLIATSQKAALTWRKPIRLLFIDGLHDYENTFLDYSLWSEWVTKDGIIAVHDAFCGHKGVEKVILEEVLPENWKNMGVVGSIIFFQKGNPQNMGEHLNIWRHKILIPLALNFNKTNMPQMLKFFLIHRVIKLLLLNPYTFLLQLRKG